MRHVNKNIKKCYDRYSYFYDLFEFLPEKLFFKKLRKKIILSLRGRVLEIGVGTGKNLPYYSDSAQVTAIDFSEKMIEHAKNKLKKLDKQNIALQVADTQALPFEDNSFDYVIATFVFCSVPDPVKGFEEVGRVLKHSGRAIFLEHVRSEGKLRSKLHDLFNPITVGLFGFNINRKTWDNIYKGKLKIIKDKKLAMNDVFRLFVCKK